MAHAIFSPTQQVKNVVFAYLVLTITFLFIASTLVETE